MEVSSKVLAGDVRAVAGLMTDLENKVPSAIRELGNLYPHTGRAHIVGVTGAPGAGKSTLINAVTKTLRQKGMSIGVIAVDPTSPFSGGAFLGDRIRMQTLCDYENVYIRSLSTQDPGGIAKITRDIIIFLEHKGFDKIIVESVGAGQSDIEIFSLVDTCVVILIPGLGDEVQILKSGINEIADIFVVNKSDIPGADRTIREIEILII